MSGAAGNAKETDVRGPIAERALEVSRPDRGGRAPAERWDTASGRALPRLDRGRVPAASGLVQACGDSFSMRLLLEFPAIVFPFRSGAVPRLTNERDGSKSAKKELGEQTK